MPWSAAARGNEFPFLGVSLWLYLDTQMRQHGRKPAGEPPVRPAEQDHQGWLADTTRPNTAAVTGMIDRLERVVTVEARVRRDRTSIVRPPSWNDRRLVSSGASRRRSDRCCAGWRHSWIDTDGVT
jgi:hypothetical protein